MKFRFSKNTTQFEILLEPSPCNHCNRDWYAMGVKVDFPSGEIILILAAMHCTLMQFVQFLCGPMIYNKTSTYATSRSVQRCGFGMGPIFFFGYADFTRVFKTFGFFVVYPFHTLPFRLTVINKMYIGKYKGFSEDIRALIRSPIFANLLLLPFITAFT